MADDAYKVLASRLGYANSPYLRRVLQVLMNPKEAEVAASSPAPAPELAAKLKITEQQVNKIVQDLYLKGILFPTSKGYFFARNTTQLHDATESDPRWDSVYGQKLFDAFEEFCQKEWYENMARERVAAAVKRSRVMPFYKSLPNIPGVLPCEDIRAVLKEASVISVVPCPCRRQTRHCEKSVNNCIQIDRAAEYAIKRGTGPNLSYKEAMAIVDQCEEEGLVYRVPNRRTNLANICTCCGDDCIAFLAYKKIGRLHDGDAPSRFEAQNTQELCDGCQDCIERCEYDAITMVKVPGFKKMKAQVDPAKCFGCGACVVKCEPQALKLKMVRPPEFIPIEAAA
ncbi:MAG: 4Fe-4S dicluster domain-containing protein [Chloroflexota bacterium]|nr:4Fe-4S dicluster domain-containing protein [Chloroflexota bacterium]